MDSLKSIFTNWINKIKLLLKKKNTNTNKLIKFEELSDAKILEECYRRG